MLLHELPILSKIQVVNNALSCANENGRVVFIDYHNPVKWHPLRYFVRMFNRLYQPFAEKLWDREIYTLADKKNSFFWRKKTYFGDMYQKAVASRKDDRNFSAATKRNSDARNKSPEICHKATGRQFSRRLFLPD